MVYLVYQDLFGLYGLFGLFGIFDLFGLVALDALVALVGLFGLSGCFFVKQNLHALLSYKMADMVQEKVYYTITGLIIIETI